MNINATPITCGVGPLGYVLGTYKSDQFDIGVSPMTPDQIKNQFRQRGDTFSQWARERGYRPQQVLRVLNGFDKGHRGKAHEIAVKLGLKASV